MKNKDEIKGYTGILLEKLTIKFDKILGDDFEIKLGDKKDIIKQNGLLLNPYTSVIIGSNGTGKSYLLKIIADILLQLYSLDVGKKEKHTDVLFELSYFNNGEKFVIKNFDDKSLKLARKKTNYTISNESDLTKPYSPERILVTSVLLTDRFTIHRDPPEPYVYLGVRNLKSPSSAGTRNYVKRTVEHVVNALAELDVEFVNKLESLLRFLKFQNTFIIYYYPKYKEKFFSEELTVEKFKSLFENYRDPERGFSKREESDRIPNNVTYYQKHVAHNTDLISELVLFLIDLRKSYLKTYGKSKVEYFEFDIINRELSLDKYRLIKELQALDIITYPSISLIKEDGNIDLEQTSSGEYHFIATMIGLFASIKQNSIVLIDEPEVSLHPNWQMKYIHFLKEIFQQYSSCHFIITSHSHFLVSDLEGKSSCVSALIRDPKSNTLSSKFLDADTFGWSAEEVLYTVFGVRSSRNSYLEYDLTKLVTMINKDTKDFGEIKRILNKIDPLQLNEADPLKVIIEKANKYLRLNNA